MSKKGYKQTKKHRNNIGNALRGKKRPAVSKGMKEYYKTHEVWNKNKKCPQLSGKNNGMFGKHHSKKTRKKIILANIKNGKYCKGKKCYCIDCGKKISKYSKRRCQSCAKTGKLNPSYINGLGKEPYPLNFNNKLKKQIRKRDDYTCQQCGKKQENYYQKLTIHHIDYDKNNPNPNNLISLCRSCNTVANKDRDYWFAYFNYIMVYL